MRLIKELHIHFALTVSLIHSGLRPVLFSTPQTDKRKELYLECFTS